MIVGWILHREYVVIIILDVFSYNTLLVLVWQI